ncbi:MAG: thiol reductant ABC exporter subunit CydC [Deltaproteobacteria bacterium]|nr:thiol reductant ABC exporter subunit CydC [Deltaproteobacteria bacterium]
MGPTIRRLLRLLAPYRFLMLGGAFLSFLTIGAAVGLLMTSAYIISKAALHPSVALIQVPIVGVRFFGLMRGILRYAERLVAHQVTFHILGNLRAWFFKELIPLAPVPLGDTHSGDLFARITADIDSLESFYVRTISPPLVALLVGGLMVALLYPICPEAAFVHLGFYVTSGIFVPWLAYRLAKPHHARLLALRSEMNREIVDGLRGMADLRVYGATDAHIDRVESLSHSLEAIHHRSAWLDGLHTALMEIMMSLAVATTLAVMLPAIQAGDVSGVLLAVAALGVMASFEAIQPLPEALSELKTSVRAADRLFEITDTRPEVTAPKTPEIAPSEDSPSGGSLSVQDLSYRFTGAKKAALDGISFTLAPGEKLAIVGPSGAGKSTLLELLLRFRRPSGGSILFGERDIIEIDGDTLRARLALVSARSHLFHNTLRENLLLAKPKADDARMLEALRSAGLEDWATKLPEGLDTWLGTSGAGVSGGERQRLLVARAILRDAPLLLLDEPTANLDINTELALVDELLRLSAGRALLWITHRLVRMEQMDEILVLDQGKIVQRGKHDALREAPGLYRDLWELQHDMLPEAPAAIPPTDALHKEVSHEDCSDRSPDQP